MIQAQIATRSLVSIPWLPVMETISRPFHRSATDRSSPNTMRAVARTTRMARILTPGRLGEGPQDIVPVRTAGHRSALAGLSPQDIVPLQQVI